MRILMLNYEFPPLGGGAANANYYLLKEFSKIENLYIDLVTSSPDTIKQEQFSDNIQIYKLRVDKSEVHHWTIFEILLYSKKAYQKAKILKRMEKYDLIHAWFGIPCGYIAKKLDLPYIVSLRGSDVPGFNVRFSPEYIFLTPIIKSVWANAEKVIANSEGLKNLALRTLDSPIEVIYNGVNTKEFTPKYDKIETLKALCVSRLIKRKGIEYLIEAIEHLNVELTIVGRGIQEYKLKQLCKKFSVEEKVNFALYVPHEEIKNYYKEADIFILPSLNEGMSNTMLEAMASGLPIITTDTGGIKELMNSNGFVIPIKNSEAITRSLDQYIKNPKLIKKHGLKSRQIAERMNWENIAKEYYRLYEEIFRHGSE